MKIIIAGGRRIEDFEVVLTAIKESKFQITEVVCGCAKGVDTLGEVWATMSNLPVKKFPADWGRYGKVAGPVRNAQMADYADGLILIWDGESRGSKNMLQEAMKRNLPRFVWMIVQGGPE